MPDIISARCFGCGNVIKVPAGLGGKKARCPQCTNTISIPMPSDTVHDDIISDAELPEVAVGNTAEREEGDAAIPGQEAEALAEDPEAKRGRGATSVRNYRVPSPPAANSRVQRSGTQQRYTGGAPAPKKAAQGSNQGMMIGIGLGVVALIILGVVVAGKSDSSKHGGKQATKERDKEKSPENRNQPQYSPEDQALISKLMDYTSSVNRGNPTEIQRFFTYEPDDERKIRIRIAQDIVDKKVVYEGVKVTSVSASGGTITFSHNGGSKTLTWKQVDGAWLIAEMPSP